MTYRVVILRMVDDNFHNAEVQEVIATGLDENAAKLLTQKLSMRNLDVWYQEEIK